MEIAVFEPLSTGNESLFGMIVLGAVVCLALGIWGWREKKQIVWMLGSFGFVILGGNAGFMKFSEQYVTPVIIYETKIDTPLGLIPFDNIVSARIEGEQIALKKIDNGEPPEKVLLLERANGRGVMMAASQYPIIKIKVALDKQISIYQKSKK